MLQDDAENDVSGTILPEDEMGVGYKHPPVHSRFQKGKSGNPKGRPKGSRNMQTILKTLFNTPVPVRQGEVIQYMANCEAMIRVLVADATKGDVQALATVLDLVEMAGHFDELTDEERNRQGVLVVPERVDMEEWTLLFSPDGAADRHRYRQIIAAEEAAKTNNPEDGSSAPSCAAAISPSIGRIPNDPWDRPPLSPELDEPRPVPFFDARGIPLYNITRLVTNNGRAGAIRYRRR